MGDCARDAAGVGAVPRLRPPAFRHARRAERRAVDHAQWRRVVQAAGAVSAFSNVPPALSALAAGWLAAAADRALVRRVRARALSGSCEPLAASGQQRGAAHRRATRAGTARVGTARRGTAQRARHARGYAVTSPSTATFTLSPTCGLK